MLEVAHVGQGSQRWDLRGQSGVVKVRAPAVSRHIFSKGGGVEGEWEGSGRGWGMMHGYAHARTGHTECKCEAHERQTTLHAHHMHTSKGKWSEGK